MRARYPNITLLLESFASAVAISQKWAFSQK
jgi:hypothetical protein